MVAAVVMALAVMMTILMGDTPSGWLFMWMVVLVVVLVLNLLINFADV